MKRESRYCLILLIMLSAVLSSAPNTLFLPPTLTKSELIHLIQEKKQHHAIEFAIDIHEVLLFKNVKEQLRLVATFPQKSLFLKNLFNIPLVTQLGALTWHWLLDISPFHGKRPEANTEQLVVILAEAGQHELAEFVTRIANAQIINKPLIPVLEALKKQGYTLHVASNIGRSVYEDLKATLAKRLENIFELFDKDQLGGEGKIVDYTQSQHSKPSDHYYQEYMATYNPQNRKLIIFVDDKKKNVLAAAENGMIGLVFESVEQLMSDLTALHLL